jgi:hypothetical protein
MGTEEDSDQQQLSSSSSSSPLQVKTPHSLVARLLPWLLLIALLVNRLDIDIGLEAIQLEVMSAGLFSKSNSTVSSSDPTNASSSSSSSSSTVASADVVEADADPLPIHAYTCVYRKDWRLVLLERPSPLYLGGTIRHLAAPVERLTLLVNRINGGTEEAQAERAFEQLCGSLAEEGYVVRCRTARVSELVSAALSYYNITVQSFGGHRLFLQSACPLVATYLEATQGDEDDDDDGDDEDESGERPRSASAVSFASPGAPLPQSLVVFWEGDVSIVRPGSWVATAAAFSGAHPSMNVSTCPCFRLMNRDECASELDTAVMADLAVPSSLRPPRLLPDDWVPFRRPRFSQQLFALPSASLASIDWKRAGSMPDEACGPFPDEGGFEHRACKWLARWEWVSAMHLDAAYVHAGLNNATLLELSEFLTGQGWPWDPQR